MISPNNDSIPDSLSGPTSKKLPRGTRLADLLDTPVHPGLANVTCALTNNVARLEGIVQTFYLKQLAQETAARVDGVDGVENNLLVQHAKIAGRA